MDTDEDKQVPLFRMGVVHGASWSRGHDSGAKTIEEKSQELCLCLGDSKGRGCWMSTWHVDWTSSEGQVARVGK